MQMEEDKLHVAALLYVIGKNSTRFEMYINILLKVGYVKSHKIELNLNIAYHINAFYFQIQIWRAYSYCIESILIQYVKIKWQKKITKIWRLFMT